ncbi:MAG: hypothetical protein R3C43_15810 [Chloroflexota bacterium]
MPWAKKARGRRPTRRRHLAQHLLRQRSLGHARRRLRSRALGHYRRRRAGTYTASPATATAAWLADPATTWLRCWATNRQPRQASTAAE